MLTIDMRCPACNEPLRGGEEVVLRRSIPTIKKCPHCGIQVRTVRVNDPDLAALYERRVV